MAKCRPIFNKFTLASDIFKVLPTLLVLGIFALLLFVSGHYWLVYSPVFNGDNDAWLPTALAKNRQASTKARDHLQSLATQDTLAFYESRLHKPSQFLVMVITCLRDNQNNSEETFYLTQVMSALDREVKSATNLNISLLICNTETSKKHTEVVRLSKLFPVVDVSPSSLVLVSESRKKEKVDYVSCLKKASFMKTDYVLVVQDDAVPLSDLFYRLEFLLHYRIESLVRQGELVPNALQWGQVKLYYPEKWQGYAWEFDRVVELLALVLVASGTCALIRYCWRSSSSWFSLLFFFLKIAAFTAIFISLVGRQYLVNWRLWSPHLLTVIDAPGCCIPAVMYPWAILHKLISYLDKIDCSSDYPLDIAIDDFLRKKNFQSYLVEPNLFRHIGMYSTLTAPKDSYYFV